MRRGQDSNLREQKAQWFSRPSRWTTPPPLPNGLIISQNNPKVTFFYLLNLYLFVLIILFISLVLLTSPVSAQAQIPLSHLLLQSYKPTSKYKVNKKLTKIISNVLGLSTSNITNLTQSITNPTNDLSQDIPPIGGQGKTITIALLGDSMIDTLGDLTFLKNSLKQVFPNKVFNIINYGLGASNIEYGLFRLSNQYDYQGQVHPSLLSQKPDILVIESFAYNNFGNTQSGIDKHWLTLGAITTKIKRDLPQTKIILAVTIAPNSVIFANGAPGTNFSAIEKIQKTNTISLYLKNTINFATSQNFILADAYNPSLKNDDGNPIFINRNDGIHPNNLGAQFFGDILTQTIEKYKLVQ